MNSYFIGPNLFSVAPEPLPQLLLSKQISPLRTKYKSFHPEKEGKNKTKQTPPKRFIQFWIISKYNTRNRF